MIEILERNLGPIRDGFSRDDEGKLLSVPMARFVDVPVRGGSALVTTGLSSHVLQQTGRSIRQELCFAYWAEQGPRNAPAMVAHLATAALSGHRAYRRGEWIAYGAPVIAGSGMVGVYFAQPFGFPEAIWQVTGLYDEPVVLVRLIPLLASEVAICEHRGWTALEEHFEAAAPDLLDLTRNEGRGAKSAG